ncbi:hypothetical protein F6X40_01625 [Paraburkholderia sp. UCT31]|uniref:hypothetical protein n=1 Tax=Paraburkholderia sp. UCT31 TaxID=2615209 RepID=UPI0016557519|nr:hypothetical protein [Paraburkholderia sp. UCT31]MBC8735564.1 hypothetical protein [Paraburkholderia sp. UCT31]
MIEQDIGCEWANLNGDHFSSKRVSSPFASDMPRLASETTATPLIIFVCWYSLIEVPSEFGMGNNDATLPAAVVARLIVIGEGFAAVVDVRFARAIFVPLRHERDSHRTDVAIGVQRVNFDRVHLIGRMRRKNRDCCLRLRGIPSRNAIGKTAHRGSI